MTKEVDKPYDLIAEVGLEALTATPEDIEVDAALADLQKYHERLILSPTRWATCRLPISLTWSAVKFEKSQRIKIPNDKQGIYTFVVNPDIANHPMCSYLIYVGKTERQSLRTRFLQYFSEQNKKKGREPVKRMLRRWMGHLWFCYATIEDLNQIDSVEEMLIGAFVPPINQEYPGIIGRAISAWN